MQRSTERRLAAICDLTVPAARESAGWHEYDGTVQDLSPDGVRRGLARLGGPRYADPHDEAQAAAAEHALQVRFGELVVHRTNPVWHVENLELVSYEREYAPEPERAAARRAHLRQWPDAVAAAIASLDRVPAPVAAATRSMADGLRAHLRPDDGDLGAAAGKAVDRLVAHLDHVAAHGEPSAALGGPALRRLLSSAEAVDQVDFDLEDLTKAAAAERDRMGSILEEACRRIDPGAPVAQTVRKIQSDHPGADGLLEEIRALVDEAIAWTTERELVPHTDGECLVGLMPPSQRGFALAAMYWSAPGEPDAPSWFRISPPDPAWPAAEQQSWLANGFNAMVLPNITVHEVAPGHFSHGRAMRHAGTPVRRTLHSLAFIEGWAHYCEELALEEGFRAGDPRHAAGVALDALRRVSRFSCAIGVHTGELTVADAAAKFAAEALVSGRSALAEARRALFDPTYGRYTWGKLVIRALRERARTQWGAEFSLLRFHTALLELGAPSLGLLDDAVLGRPGG
ncbi:MAG: DUF885 domain-containing protein [Pseudonocardiaceae bacterium]|nr:DUF885 domain-containing protein [Pseudonocardiaceae bacterium]